MVGEDQHEIQGADKEDHSSIQHVLAVNDKSGG